MSDKAENKKKYIIQKAKEVFEKKGYLKVTMKDIVEACEISRGGLYLYFENVEQILFAVLEAQKESEAQSEDSEIDTDSPAGVLELFLQEQKKEILKQRESLARALFEYYLHCEFPRKENNKRKQFMMTLKAVEQLIIAGNEAEEFDVYDPYDAALNIMYVLEGMSITAVTIGISEEDLDREIWFIMQNLYGESDEDLL